VKNNTINKLREDNINEERIIFLDGMRAFAILMVVGVHALGYCSKLPNITHDAIRFIVQTVSVPVFFLVDGFLFAHMNLFKPKITYSYYIKKSATRLLIPWAIFVIGYSIVRYFFEFYNFFDIKELVGQPIMTIVKYSYGSVIAPQLYFLFSLFLIRMMFPVTKQLFKINRHYVIISSIMIIILLETAKYSLFPYLNINGGQEPILHALWGMQFYLIGINLYIFKNDINNTIGFVLFFSLLCIVYFLSKTLLTVPFIGIIVQYFYLLSFYFALSLFPANFPLVSSIGANTMGIYLLHAPIILKAISKVTNYFIKSPLLSYIVLCVLVFISSYLLTILINRIPFGSILFGSDYNNKRSSRLSSKASVKTAEYKA
jgi:surface polysaccharide O-acyltransferase-like enzyme